MPGSGGGTGMQDMDMMGMMNQMMGMMGQMMGKMDQMGGMSGSGDGMSMMDDMDMPMDNMPGASSSGMDMMGMMGGMGGSGMQASPSALPGFPGASHIYHMGATDFFLDHATHITLTTDQKSALEQIKQDALMEQGTFDRQIDEKEQDLWKLTASDQPEIQQIEAKVRELEKLYGEQRVAFIRAVGKAATILNDAQRKSLLGTAPPNPDPAASGMSGMQDM
ncbi:hypothetical protein HYR69_02620 [Candidatus Sumerlaeota bacterium]|nr:hypothetical protein [Candidatus Sumerlaeota bacterium]